MIQQFHSWAYTEEKKKKTLNFNLKRYMYPSGHSSTIYNSQDMEATQVPINRHWVKKIQ